MKYIIDVLWRAMARLFYMIKATTLHIVEINGKYREACSCLVTDSNNNDFTLYYIRV